MEITNKTFLISGGGSGLGAATAKLLGAHGAQVIVADINRETGESTAKEIGPNARFVETNVTDEESVKNAIDTAISAFGSLNGAINCAGIGVAERTVGKDAPHSLATFRRVIEVNLIGTFNVIRLAATQMSRQEPTAGGERGVIVNTASVAAPRLPPLTVKSGRPPILRQRAGSSG
jgi:NAD(P)-dependent dehydrogenase (short-subunit alcohol dehydrogenase family)